METTTPNIGLTKPVLTENVSLTVINDNYDKIDTEFGKLTNLFKITSYNCTISSLSAGSAKALTKQDFNITTPTGYKIAALLKFGTNKQRAIARLVDLTATGADPVMVVDNTTGSSISSITAYLTILYVKSAYVE